MLREGRDADSGAGVVRIYTPRFGRKAMRKAVWVVKLSKKGRNEYTNMKGCSVVPVVKEM